MIPENYKILIEKLKLKTDKKEAVWSKTSRDNEFKLDLGKGAITVDSYSEDYNRFIDMTILNDRGDTIDRIFFTSNEEEEYHFLSDLHTLARRAYYKIDETIKEIFKELDSNKTIGNENVAPLDDLPF